MESPRVELRVEVGSKTDVSEQLDRYKRLLGTLLDGQKHVDEDTKRLLLQELLADFEAGVQDNVLVEGRPWAEAPDGGSSDLDDLLDDAIVEAAWRRRIFPRRALTQVVHRLRAERRLMELFEQAVQAADVLPAPGPEGLLGDVAAAAPRVVKEAVQVVQAIQAVQRQAEGLRQILNHKPSPTSLEVHQEVLGHVGQSEARLLPEGGTRRGRRPIGRAVEEAAAAGGYVPPAKKPVG